jgi:EmrB/QacA subfamily drug resistance transporter
MNPTNTQQSSHLRTSEHHGAAGETAAKARRLKVTMVVLAGVFIALLDVFIVSISFPAIHQDFPGSSLADLSWVVSAYAIVSAALVIPAGRWSDRGGRRRAFLGGLALFVAASAVCAAAPSVSVLIAARCVQAVGGAFMVPSSLGLLLPEFAPERRAAAIGLWGAVSGVAAAAGPLLGGLLVQASWRWVFLVNVPIGLITLIAGIRVLREVRDPSGARPDALGAAWLAAAVGALTLAIVKAPDWGWGSAHAVGLYGTAVILFAALAFRSRRHPAPIVEPVLVGTRPVALANAANLLFQCAFAATVLGGVLFLTSVWHQSVLHAGLEIAPGPATAAVFAFPGGILGQRYGQRLIGTVGALLFALGGIWRLAYLGPTPHYYTQLLPALVIGGAATGLALPSISAAATIPLPPQRLATGSGMLGVSRGTGFALGVAILVAILGNQPHTAGAFDGAWLMLTVAATASVAVLAALGPVRRYQTRVPMSSMSPTPALEVGVREPAVAGAA